MENKKDWEASEAEGKVGKSVRSLIEFSGVPKGTHGKVIRMDQGEGRGAIVAVEWDLPARTTIAGREFQVQRTKPLVDWFSKDEYEDYLLEI